ncbi:hypothetical protein D3C85_1575870 [compost metagenome]
MVIVSILLVPIHEYVIVIVEAVTEIEGDDRLRLLVSTVTVPVLIRNSKLAGALRIKVIPVPGVKLLLTVSVIIISPKVLYAEGNPEQEVIDKLGCVIVTCAFVLVLNKMQTKTIKSK